MTEKEDKNNKIIIEKGVLDLENENKYKEIRNLYQKSIDFFNL